MSVSGMCIAFSWLFSIIYSFPSWHRSKCSWTGGSEKCSHLCGRLSICSESELGISEFHFILHSHLVMIVLYSNVFLIAKQRARKIENLSSKTGQCSESFQDRVAKREKGSKNPGASQCWAFLISWLPYFSWIPSLMPSRFHHSHICL